MQAGRVRREHLVAAAQVYELYARIPSRDGLRLNTETTGKEQMREYCIDQTSTYRRIAESMNECKHCMEYGIYACESCMKDRKLRLFHRRQHNIDTHF
jgi:hypothetical protein